MLSVVLLLATQPADVVAAGPNGFHVKGFRDTRAAPNVTYGRMVDVSKWWDADHSYSGKAENWTLEARANGCLCESLDDGGSVAHLRVVHVVPNQLIRFTGGLGPLQPMGISGTMTWSFESRGTGTRIHYEYIVSGFLPSGFEGLAGPVDGVVAGQIDRLAKSAQSTSFKR